MNTGQGPLSPAAPTVVAWIIHDEFGGNREGHGLHRLRGKSILDVQPLKGRLISKALRLR